MAGMSKSILQASIFLGACLGFSASLYASGSIYHPKENRWGYQKGGGAGTFIFNPRTHSYVAISSNGRVVRSGRASGGRSYCPDIRRSCRTPQGVFYVRSKGGPGCVSSRYPVGRGGAKMPYCMFYSSYYAIHGSYDVPNANVSHGCIRVTPGDALWLSRNFIRIGTRVVVKSY